MKRNKYNWNILCEVRKAPQKYFEKKIEKQRGAKSFQAKSPVVAEVHLLIPSVQEKSNCI